MEPYQYSIRIYIQVHIGTLHFISIRYLIHVFNFIHIVLSVFAYAYLSIYFQIKDNSYIWNKIVRWENLGNIYAKHTLSDMDDPKKCIYSIKVSYAKAIISKSKNAI